MDKQTMKVVLGIVGIAIAMIMFPIVLDGAADILEDGNISSYSGLQSVVQIAPLIIFVGLLFGSGASIWSGAGMSARIGKSRKKKAKAPVYRRPY